MSFKYFKKTKQAKDARRRVIVKEGYGSDWYKQRHKARERDNYTCQACGYVGKKQKNGRWDIEVHHKRKIAYFVNSITGVVNYKEANDLDNLITLCVSCHKHYDGKPNGFKTF